MIATLSLFALFWSQQNTVINQSLNRIYGIEHAINVSTTMNKIAKHRGMTAALLAGDNQFSSLQANARQQANATINIETQLISSTKNNIVTPNQWNQITSSWKSLLATSATLSPAQNFEQHSKIIGLLEELLIIIDERSGLTFNENRTASYSARLIINQLPVSLETLGRIRGISAGTAAKGAVMTRAHYTTLSDAIQFVKQYEKAIHHSLDIIKEYSPKISAHISQGASVFFKNTDNFIQLVNTKILEPDLITVKANQIFQSGTEAITSAQKLEDILGHQLQSILENRISALRFKTYGILVAMIALILVSLISGILILKSIIKRLNFTESIFKEIEQGNYENQITITGEDEIDSLLKKLSAMQIQMKESRIQEQKNNAEIAHIKTALDRTTSNIMLVNTGGEIIYLNDAFQENFRGLQQQIQTELPTFNIDKVIGSQLATFNTTEFNGTELTNTNQTVKKDITIGELKFRYTVSPIVDQQGAKTGIVMEWIDRTDQVEIESQINNVVNQAKAGNLAHRMTLNGQTGFFRNIGTGINDLVEINDSFICETGQVMEALAIGDLSKTMEGEYSGEFETLKYNINKTIFKLRDIINQIKSSALEVRMDASRIKSGNENLKLRTDQQATSLEQSASSMEQITGTVKNSTANAHRASEMSALARKKAEESGKSVNRTIAAMDEICESSKKISDITSVIDEIAFQTNLLALNAAVEAAHAGDQGKGFAVVASEVRELAQRSSEAAHKIKDLILDSNEKVHTGTELVKNSGEVLKEIIGDVANVSERISEIADAGDEQAMGVEMINNSVSQIDTVTQQNTDLVKQTAGASEHLSLQAQQLVKLVDFFSTGSSRHNAISTNIYDINAA